MNTKIPSPPTQLQTSNSQTSPSITGTLSSDALVVTGQDSSTLAGASDPNVGSGGRGGLLHLKLLQKQANNVSNGRQKLSSQVASDLAGAGTESPGGITVGNNTINGAHGSAPDPEGADPASGTGKTLHATVAGNIAGNRGAIHLVQSEKKASAVVQGAAQQASDCGCDQSS